MQQKHYSRQTTQLTGGRGTRQVLHDGKIESSPVLALFFGGPGTLLGLFTNGWQVYTTQIGFMDMLNDRTGLFGLLNLLPAMATKTSTTSPIVVILCWMLAIAVQFGVIFLSMRIEKEFKQQLGHAQGENQMQKVGYATKGTFVVISHDRDFFFYYGVACFVLDGLGDYAFVTTFTGNVVFLAFYGLITMMTSTIILAVAAEWLWIGILALMNAWAGAQAHARRGVAREGRD